MQRSIEETPVDWTLRVGHRVDAFKVLRAAREKNPNCTIISINLAPLHARFEGERLLTVDCQQLPPSLV